MFVVCMFIKATALGIYHVRWNLSIKVRARINKQPTGWWPDNAWTLLHIEVGQHMTSPVLTIHKDKLFPCSRLHKMLRNTTNELVNEPNIQCSDEYMESLDVR